MCAIPEVLEYPKMKAGQVEKSGIVVAWSVEIRKEDLEVVPLCIAPDVARMIQEVSRRISGRETTKDRRDGDEDLWNEINSRGSHRINLTDLYDLSDRGKKSPRKKKIDPQVLAINEMKARIKAGEITKEAGALELTTLLLAD